VATLDTAWSRIRATYYDTTFRGLDWGGVRERLRPLAARARTATQLREVVEMLFDELDESHFALIPGELAATWQGDTLGVSRPGDIGLEMRLVENQVLVTRVGRSSPAERAGIEPGWLIEGIDDFDAATMLRQRAGLSRPRERAAAEIQIPLKLMAATLGAAETRLTVRARTREGEARRLTVTRRPWRGEVVQYGILPPQYFAFEHERFVDDAGCVGVVRFTNWMTPLLPHLERAMRELADCRGMVVDLRGNVGGVGALVMGTSGFFLDRELTLGTLRARNMTLRYVSNPRRVDRAGHSVEPFKGPLAIVVDGLSASTSEIFAAGMRDVGRARLFGETTPGQALPATLARLPNGDVMMHAIADFRSAAGQRLEAVGIVPDEIVKVRRADLRSGNDAQLLAALRWISSERASTASRGSRTGGPGHP
jgi:carboxyl-terminal processing protease